MGLLDLIFPKYCVNCKKFGDFLCASCFSRLSFDTKSVCMCKNPSFNGLTHVRCLGKYCVNGVFTAIVPNKISNKLIYQFKNKPYLSGLSSFLADLLFESLIQKEEFDRVTKPSPILVPIPLSAKVLRKRGYNQAEALAKELSKKLSFPVQTCLVRENTKSAFALRAKYTQEVKNENIFLIDDALSSFTITEAAKVLKKAGARKVFAISVI